MKEYPWSHIHRFNYSAIDAWPTTVKNVSGDDIEVTSLVLRFSMNGLITADVVQTYQTKSGCWSEKPKTYAVLSVVVNADEKSVVLGAEIVK